jgi:hypothetical protein
VPGRWKMIPETLDLRTSLILLSSQRITGQKTIEASKLEPLTTNRCRGQHLTLDDDTLLGSNKIGTLSFARRTTGGLAAEPRRNAMRQCGVAQKEGVARPSISSQILAATIHSCLAFLLAICVRSSCTPTSAKGPPWSSGRYELPSLFCRHRH